MVFTFFQGSRWPLRFIVLAITLLIAIPMFGLESAQADNNSFWQLFRRRSDDGAPASTNWSSHSGNGTRATTTTEIVNDGSVSPFLTPGSAAALEAAAARYAQIVASGGWGKVPGGKLKKGVQGKAVVALNQRLYAEGYLRPEATQGEFAQTYTTATEDAVTRFQRNHGLAVTGVVDNSTVAELNVPAERRLATIRANLPRVAEYSRDLGPRYIVVNVPAQQIEAINNGTVYSIHNAIVGRPSRPTPVVMTNVATVKFNPYWNAPPSIVERDILPRMRSSGASRVLRDMNMKVFDGVGGPEVNPDRINWRRAVIDDYHFRQEPGGSNAMATAKIEFNSPFGIYMHDTPEPQLFATGQRFYSSGCVRVEKVAILLNWILNGQNGIDNARIAGLAESKERLDVPVVNPPQLRVAYLTAWPGRNGEVNFRPDVYELDGSGFVMGQPLPVGESQGGQRFVLKPIPRDPSAVDADEAFGFFNLFNRSRNSDKYDLVSSHDASQDDSLISGSKPKKPKVVSATSNWFSVKTNEVRTTLKKATSAAKPAKDTKLATKTPPKKPVGAASPAKAVVAVADTCKAAADGKLPPGCPPQAVPKPKAKPEAETRPQPAAN